MLFPHVNIAVDKVEAFCHRWKIRELSIFGSALREDFKPDSDVDVLVSFSADHPWSLFDLEEMETELQTIVGRKVDFVIKDALRNPFRRHDILRTRRILYAA